uniref:Uncharacterized protein n=1 Tax=Rhizophagus irregularis (strain DAOM 181602 / DAOM 197198 / MUCL 43194) TaxID=747089 RepID=U9UTF8_RHIID
MDQIQDKYWMKYRKIQDEIWINLFLPQINPGNKTESLPLQSPRLKSSNEIDQFQNILSTDISEITLSLALI